MKTHFTIIFSITILCLMSCNDKVSSDYNKKISKGGLDFIVNCENTSGKNKLNIKINGLTEKDYDYTTTIDALVEGVYVRDLNMDNFQELYVLLSKNDGSGNKDFIALGSNKNKTAGEIKVQNPYQKMKPNTDVFIMDENFKRRYESAEKNSEQQKIEITYVLVDDKTGLRLIPNMHYVK